MTQGANTVKPAGATCGNKNNKYKKRLILNPTIEGCGE
jgi:hypothetical protein